MVSRRIQQPAWEQVVCSVAPGPAVADLDLERAGHTATVDGKYIYVLGGRKGSKFYSDLLRFDLERHAWVRVLSQAPCQERAHHTATRVGDELWVIGGSSNDDVCSAVYTMSLKCLSWRKQHIRDDEGLLTRMAHTAVVHPMNHRAILIFGGYGCPSGSTGTHRFLNDLLVLHTDRRELQRVAVMGAPPVPRCYHSMSVLGTKCYVFGGRCEAPGGSMRLVDGDDVLAVYHADTQVWEAPPLSVSGTPPAPRSSHRAAALQDRIVIFGGCGEAAREGAPERRLEDVHTLVASGTGRLHWSGCDSPCPGGAQPQGRAAHSMSVVKSQGTPYLYVLCGYLGHVGGEGAAARKFATDCYRLGPLASLYVRAKDGAPQRAASPTAAQKRPQPSPQPQRPANKAPPAAAAAGAAVGVASEWHQLKRPRTAQQQQQAGAAPSAAAAARREQRHSPLRGGPWSPQVERITVSAAALAVSDTSANAEPVPVSGRRRCAGVADGPSAREQHLEVELAKVQAELEAAQRDGAHALSERGRQLQQLQAQLAAQQQEDAGLLRQWQHEQSENARLRSELQAKRTELQVAGAAEQRAAAMADRLRSEVSELSEQRQAMAAELSTARGQLSQARGELSDARGELKQARAEAVDRQRQLQEAGSRLRDCEASLQGEERKHAAHVAKLGQQLAEKEAVLAQRDEQVGRLRQSVQDQSEQLHAARAKAAEAQLQGDAKALELQHQLQEREQGLAASKAQADALHQEVAQLRCSLQQANSDLQAALARNKVLEAETAKADLELAKERADKHALKHQAAAAGKRLDERQAAVMQAVVALRMVQSLQDEERLARGGCAPPGPSAGGG